MRRSDETPIYEYESGDYGRVGGVWYAKSPTGLLCNLTAHDVEEHEDGTITASPSILVHAEGQTWHGWLKKGVWTT